MADFLKLKIDGRTTRGKILDTWSEADGFAAKGRIALSGTCLSCNAEPDDQPLECMKCKSKYHNLCLTITLSSDVLVVMEKNPCIWWFCPDCLTTGKVNSSKSSQSINPKNISFNTSNDADSEQVVSGGMDSGQFRSEMNDFKVDILKSVQDAIDAKLGPSRPTFSSMVSSNVTGSASPPSSQIPKKPQPEVVKPAEVLMLSPIDNDREFSAADIDQVKKSIGGKLKNLQVEFVHSNPKKKTVAIGFRDERLRDQANEVICADAHLSGMGFKSKNANKLLPKITISGVPVSILESVPSDGSIDKEKTRELEKNIIIEKIKEKNPSIADLVALEHTLSVVFVGRVKRFEKDTLTIGLKVSPLIRSTLFLKQCGVIYLDYSRYHVSDRYYIKQCYHCQLLGHTSDNCPDSKASKPSVCMYCSENHRSKMCLNKHQTQLHNCARCKSSALTSDSSGYKTHHAGSTSCPMIVRETVRLANMTDLTSKNAM
mgnify:CR=1 FL=1